MLCLMMTALPYSLTTYKVKVWLEYWETEFTCNLLWRWRYKNIDASICNNISIYINITDRNNFIFIVCISTFSQRNCLIDVYLNLYGNIFAPLCFWNNNILSLTLCSTFNGVGMTRTAPSNGLSTKRASNEMR